MTARIELNPSRLLLPLRPVVLAAKQFAENALGDEELALVRRFAEETGLTAPERAAP